MSGIKKKEKDPARSTTNVLERRHRPLSIEIKITKNWIIQQETREEQMGRR